jgi:5-(carboxyamino)imidazole ribonucleotide synthase
VRRPLGEHLRADYSDPDHLRQLADEVDLVTFEFESVPAETVAFLSQFVPVYPSAEALRIARDRWFEKSMFKDLGIPTPAFADIQSQADLDAAVASIGLPAVFKTRTLGYDGKGQKVLRTGRCGGYVCRAGQCRVPAGRICAVHGRSVADCRARS